MKSKLFLSAIILFTATNAFSQDTTFTLPPKVTFKDKPQTQSKKVILNKIDTKKKKVNTVMYRDTRLGSSSPLYNTYKKNKNGAGAVTTNPNKIQSGSNSEVIFLRPDSTRKK